MSHGGSKPYIEKKIDENTFLREFSVNIKDKDLEWHRDAEDREIEVMSGKNWKFQYDNCLPVIIKSGDKISIKKNEWHRIIKGDTNLKLTVHK
jgi:quercetin dioxygenase-like cupin family protein|tara:strand:- start:86 stop:364 length:279 start_codon:yes stop_codon:yes gene_type:complete